MECVSWRAIAIPLFMLAGNVSASGTGVPETGIGPQDCADEQERVSRAPWPTPFLQLAAARCLVAAGDLDAAVKHVHAAVDHQAFRAAGDLLVDIPLQPLLTHPAWNLIAAEANRKSQLPAAVGSGVDIAYMRANLPPAPRSLRPGRPVRVILVVWVSPEAEAAHIDIEQSSGNADVDAIAVAAAASWRYTPAVSQGATFGYPMRLPLTFMR